MKQNSRFKSIAAIAMGTTCALTFCLSSVSAASLPKKNYTYTGSAICTWTKKKATSTGMVSSKKSTAGIKCVSGKFKGYTIAAKCVEPSKRFPSKGVKYIYKAKVASVNEKTKKVTVAVVFAPKKSGYQKMRGINYSFVFK